MSQLNTTRSGGSWARIQSLGNVAASGAAGLLWTTVSPTGAFVYLAAWMAVPLLAMSTQRGRVSEGGRGDSA